MGLLDDIWTKIVGDAAAQQSAPTPQPQPGYGLLSPQMMTPDQFARNQNSLGGILGAFSGGVLPGLAQLAGGDPNTTAARYNAMLQQAQGVETGRLNLRPFENAGAGASPNQMRSPLTASSAPGQDTYGPPDPNAAAIPLNWGQGGITQASAQSAQPAQSANILDPTTIAQQIQFLRQSPAGMAMVPKYMEVLDSMNKLGTGFDANGNQYRLGGADQSQLRGALSGKGISTGGVDPNDPNSVNAAVAGQAGATKYAEANETNRSDLFYKPQIAGSTAWATLDPEAQKARDAAAAKWLSPLEQRPGSQTLFPGGLPGAPQQRPLGYLPTNQRSFTPNAPASQPAPVGNGVLSQNSPEANKDQTNLAEETQASRKAADGAYQMRDIYGEMLKALPGANLGRYAESKTNWKNFATTYIPFWDSSKSITQDQVFDKMSTQVAGQATAQLDQTANAALETMKKAYPNREMTPEALRRMIGQLTGLQEYVITKDAARQNHIETTGSASGFTQSPWMRNNPPSKFIDAGIKAAEGTSSGKFGAAEPAEGPSRVTAPIATSPVSATGQGLRQFSSPGDPNLKMLPRGAHFLDANGVERVKP